MIKLMKYGQLPNSEIFARVTPEVNVAAVVSDILSTVRKEGDRAVLAYTKKLDGADLAAIEVSEAEIEEAFRAVEPRFQEILRSAA